MMFFLREKKEVYLLSDMIKLDFPGGSTVKYISIMQETQFWSLGQKDPLEKDMATHSSILACEIPWTE